LATGTDELRVLLKGFNGRTGSHISAVVTHSGVPLAAVLPEDVPLDNFATMAATLLGALEVIYATMKEPSPGQVVVQSENGALIVRIVTPKAFFVTLTEASPADLQRAVEETATQARALLTKPS
jgi:predicted regulator of Ras-like GTPase activity (Roadblock/LC7/MglB family)